MRTEEEIKDNLKFFAASQKLNWNVRDDEHYQWLLKNDRQGAELWRLAMVASQDLWSYLKHRGL